MDNFNIKSILVILFLFFIGCIMGWCIEVIFRKFFSKSNPSHKWINPGFLIGPYLPLYGSGLVVLYLLSLIHIDAVDSHPVLQKVLIILIMTIAMTVVEYIAGRIFIIGMNIKLWDYSDEWGNIQGIICPLFSFFWGLIAALYYFFLHPHILNAVYWLADHLTFSFFIGFFYGVFVIDCVVSFNLMNKVKKFAKENDLIVRVEELKSKIALDREKRKEKPSFLLILHDTASVKRAFEDHPENFSITKKIKEKAEQLTEAIKEKSEGISAGIGKSTTAMLITAELKKMGLNADYINETAKLHIYNGESYLLDGSIENQISLFKEQKEKIDMMYKSVHLSVTDSPLLMYGVYAKKGDSQSLHEFKEAICTMITTTSTYYWFVTFRYHTKKKVGFTHSKKAHRLIKKLKTHW